ncbi:unnamed protein product [Albugo candida]|uniref:Uncharacterized protein n=1 Tax=Albugo candida TaxID=65357 RepID=A0A024G3R1_9STRA|nr:unnamed protein product [Albugo candida]|eukprot:CCI41483.1 unnamed protein product [Albugo candida]
MNRSVSSMLAEKHLSICFLLLPTCSRMERNMRHFLFRRNRDYVILVTSRIISPYVILDEIDLTCVLLSSKDQFFSHNVLLHIQRRIVQTFCMERLLRWFS